MLKNNLFISHASEDKEQIVNPFVECLSKNRITPYWYDKEQIEGGDIMVEKINEGLSVSKIGIVIFSKHYLQKYWTTWELMVILTLVITHKIRIIPFISNDITYEQIIERYPIMAPIKFEPIPPCNEIISLVKSKMSEACRIYDDPTSVSGISYALPKNGSDNVSNENQGEQNTPELETQAKVPVEKLSSIFDDLKSSTIPEIKQIALVQIRNLSHKKDLWKEKISWEIIELLINSDQDTDRRDGLYVLTEMLKRSKRTLGETNYVVINANELFGHKLLESIESNNTDRISSDSLNVLEMIMDYDSLFDICLAGLIDGIIQVKVNNEYSSYVSKFYYRLEKGNARQKDTLCEQMKKLVKRSKEQYVRNRALNVFSDFNCT